jgi:hypothetical protein
VNVYELRVRGIEDERRLAALRWDLFVFPEVRDVVQTPRAETVAVLYEGGHPDPEAWSAALKEAGYDAPAGDDEPLPAA